MTSWQFQVVLDTTKTVRLLLNVACVSCTHVNQYPVIFQMSWIVIWTHSQSLTNGLAVHVCIFASKSYFFTGKLASEFFKKTLTVLVCDDTLIEIVSIILDLTMPFWPLMSLPQNWFPYSSLEDLHQSCLRISSAVPRGPACRLICLHCVAVSAALLCWQHPSLGRIDIFCRGPHEYWYHYQQHSFCNRV